MLPSTNIQSIIGATLFGADDAKIGRITKVLVDAADGHPTFAEVHTGFLGHATRMVPLDDARWERDDVYVSFTAEQVKSAPHLQGSEGLSPDEEGELRRHFAGVGDGDGRDEDGRDRDRDRDPDHGVRDHDRGDRDRDRDGDHRDQHDDLERDRSDSTPAHAAGDVPPLPAEIQEGQVIREERLVVRREPVVGSDDDGTGRHADTPDAPRI